MSAAELFWVTKHGVKMTGMPPWGSTHADDALWPVVALMRVLPELDVVAYDALLDRAEGMGHHAGDAAADGHDHAVMFLWAVCFPLISVGLSDSPPMTFAALRAVLSGGVLIGTAQVLGRPAVADRSMWGVLVLVGLTATSLGFFGMFYGGGRVSPGLATVIANKAVLAWGFLNEHRWVVQRWGLAAGFGGILLIGMPSLSGIKSQLSGIGFILVSAVAIAVSNVALKRLAGRVDILRAMGWQLLIGALPLAVLAMAVEDVGAVNWSWRFTVTLIALSVFGTSAAFALWFALLPRASLSQLNVFSFLTPIFGLIIGVAFFAERLHALELTGIGLSLLGIYGVSRLPKVAAPAMAPRES